MNFRAVAAVFAIGFMPQAGSSNELSGANVDVSHYQFTSSSKGTRQALRGSFELGIGPEFSAQLDVGTYKFGQSGTSGRAGTLHGIYHFDYGGAVGAFWGTEDENTIDRNFFGIEGVYDFTGITLEGYLSRGRVQGAYATGLGGKLSSDVNNRLSLNAKVDYLDNKTGSDLTRLAIGADFALGSGVNLYGELGTGNARISNNKANDAFFGLGLSFDLGERPGTTFGRRAIIDILPGM
ncbi:hypothetical protein [Primorskyibacter sp. S87]|uniref:hypothetical protein n=1 Tax=Primorskyibacter sp. S87 TaxID=3415126 RepID=UPI003C7ADCB7